MYQGCVTRNKRMIVISKNALKEYYLLIAEQTAKPRRFFIRCEAPQGTCISKTIFFTFNKLKSLHKSELLRHCQTSFVYVMCTTYPPYSYSPWYLAWITGRDFRCTLLLSWNRRFLWWRYTNPLLRAFSKTCGNPTCYASNEIIWSHLCLLLSRDWRTTWTSGPR